MHDKKNGYAFQISISPDNFETHSTLIIVNTFDKDKIFDEIRKQIPNLAFQNKQHIAISSNVIHLTKLWCYACNKEHPANQFHKNTFSPLFASRNGYCPICSDCAYTRASRICQSNSVKTGILFLCGQFDRPFIKWLADEVLNMDLSPVEQMKRYFKRVNLAKGSRAEVTFTLTDLFQNMEVEHGK